MKKTVIAIVLTIAACLCVFGTTFAWLMDSTGEVVNTFTVGDVDIELTESENLDLKLVPGKTITKDPKVTVVAESEHCWVFVKIEKANNVDNFIEYTIDSGWTALAENDGVYYREVSAADAAAGKEYAIIANNQVEVKEDVTKAQLDAVAAAVATDATKAPSLTFTAYAVQYDAEDIKDATTAWGIVNP